MLKKLSNSWGKSILCDTSILYSPFCLPYPWLLIWQFCMEMMRFWMLSTEIRYSSFFKIVSVFQNILFKVKLLERSQISNNCRIKTCSLKWRALLKIPSTGFWKNLWPFLLSLKWNHWNKTFPSFKVKTNLNFAVNLPEISSCSFLLSIWWITFFNYLYSFNMR